MDEKDIKLHWHLFSFQVDGGQIVSMPVGRNSKNVTDKDIAEAREDIAKRMVEVEHIIISSISYLGNMSYNEFFND